MKNANSYLVSTDDLTGKVISEQLKNSGQAVSMCRQSLCDIVTEIGMKAPDILLFGELGTKAQTFKALKELGGISGAPNVIVMTDRYQSDKAEYLRHGAAGIIPKRTTAAEIISLAGRLKKLSNEKEVTAAGISFELELYSTVSGALIELGITPRYTGYTYIREAISHIVHDPYSSKGISKNIYPTIAKMHSINAAGIERSIRTAITKSWDRVSEDIKKKYFGQNLQLFRNHPTNSEYICILAEYILVRIKLEQTANMQL